MNANTLSTYLAALVGIAMVTTLVSHSQTANVIKAGTGFVRGSLLAAQGK
jgi:hypothetical protein